MQEIEEAQDAEVVEEVWSIKRILIGLVVLVILGGIGYSYKDQFIAENRSKLPAPFNKIEVKGANTKEDTSTISIPSVSNLQEQAQKQIGSLKKQVSQLDAEDIASSSPQVQKILQDLKNLQDLPKNQAKEACMKVCNGI